MGKLSRTFYHMMEGMSMFDRSELYYEKLDWNCKLDAMWCDDESEDEEDDEE